MAEPSLGWRVVRTIAWVVIGIASLAGTGWLFARYTGGLDSAAELAGQVSPGRWVIVVLLTAAFYALD